MRRRVHQITGVLIFLLCSAIAVFVPLVGFVNHDPAEAWFTLGIEVTSAVIILFLWSAPGA